MTSHTDITAAECRALRAQVLTRLSGIDDLRMAYETEDFEKAERLSVEFGDGLRLMQDLGWGPASAGRAARLTMPPEQLRRVFTGLRSDVAALRADEEREEAEAQSEAQLFRERARLITEACERVLAGAPPPSDPDGARWRA